MTAMLLQEKIRFDLKLATSKGFIYYESPVSLFLRRQYQQNLLGRIKNTFSALSKKLVRRISVFFVSEPLMTHTVR